MTRCRRLLLVIAWYSAGHAADVPGNTAGSSNGPSSVRSAVSKSLSSPSSSSTSSVEVGPSGSVSTNHQKKKRRSGKKRRAEATAVPMAGGAPNATAASAAAPLRRAVVLSFPVEGVGELTLREGDEPCSAVAAFCDAAAVSAEGAIDAAACAAQLARRVQSDRAARRVRAPVTRSSVCTDVPTPNHTTRDASSLDREARAAADPPRVGQRARAPSNRL